MIDFEQEHFCGPFARPKGGRKMRALKNCGKRYCVLCAAMFVILALTFFPVAAQARQSGVKITILHLNDTHGHITPYRDKNIDSNNPVSGSAFLAKMIQTERMANPGGTILLSAGDMFQGTPISNLFHGRPVIEIMNYLRFDAMALGNHEFDWGRDVLDQIVASAKFPVLSANITGPDGKYLKGVRPHIMTRRKNVSIGIIGVTTPETEYTTKPGNVADLTIAPPAAVIPRMIRDLRAKGAALIIVLSHLGLDEDRRLAKKVRGIDLIVGGHSHTAITEPVNESGTIIVQAGSYGTYLGVLELVFDPKSKQIVSSTETGALKLVSAALPAQADRKVARIVDSYEKQVKAKFSKVIGTTALDLTRQVHKESNLGDLIADAMREGTGAQVAFFNGAGIRADLPKGPITLENIFTVLPFDNVLLSMDLTGEQIRKLLEQSIDAEKDLQFSGLKVEYDLSQPSGSKAVSVAIGDKPLDPAAVYRVATNDFLAAGGDRYVIFKEGKNVVFGSEIREVVVDYIRRNSPLSPRTEGRITFRSQ